VNIEGKRKGARRRRDDVKQGGGDSVGPSHGHFEGLKGGKNDQGMMDWMRDSRCIGVSRVRIAGMI
jgi:hypothetical protein